MTYKKTRSEKEKLIDLNKMWAIIQKNFIVIVRDKARIFPLVLFPVFMILIFGYTSGNPPKHVSTAIIAYDHSPLSQKIQQAISNSQTLAVRYMLSTEGEGKKLLDSNNVKVLIEIPANLQQKIDKGEQVGITVTVDESDSSVANVVKQVLTAITSSTSKEVSVQKISSFQNSVDAALQKLQSYNSYNINKYSLIVSKMSSAESALDTADKAINYNIESLDNSLISPTLVVASNLVGNRSPDTFNITYLPETAGYVSTKGQIAALMQSSNLIKSAEQNIKAARDIASQEDKRLKSIQDYQFKQNNLVEPSRDIKSFTVYNANAILQPVAYVEKPAYGRGRRDIDFLIPSIIALTIFQGAVMGMGRAVAGEKREGSLTRVFLTPTSNVTIILGTLLFYVIFEIFRSSFLIFIAINFFHIKIEGSLIVVFVVVMIYAGVSTAIGMFLSSIVKTEQQYFAVAMLVGLPTMFLSGVFFPLQAMPKILQMLASFLPVTYAAEALRGIMIKGFSIITISYNIFILLVFLALTVGACFMVFKREIG